MLDVKFLETIVRGADLIESEYGFLDLLFNNAGITPSQLTALWSRDQFGDSGKVKK